MLNEAAVIGSSIALFLVVLMVTTVALETRKLDIMEAQGCVTHMVAD